MKATEIRSAFTIIEILVSVIIISFSIIYVLKIHTDNHEQIVYISERNKHSLQDSLYLTKNILKYNKTDKTAYEILERHIKVDELKSRTLLKKNERDIFIPEALRIIPPPNGRGPTATANQILLKKNHSASFYRFKITSF